MISPGFPLLSSGSGSRWETKTPLSFSLTETTVSSLDASSRDQAVFDIIQAVQIEDQCADSSIIRISQYISSTIKQCYEHKFK
uniref:Uncharacterized protein n=1 Tax=Setaria italica TaxID=4555 RepID=K3ZKN1_SETIT